jgi:hypothetical protein
MWRRGPYGVAAAAIWSAMMVSSCAKPPDPEEAAKLPEGVAAHDVVDLLARGEVDAVEARVDPSQRQPNTPDVLRTMAAYFPAGAPTRDHLVGYESNTVHMVGGSTTVRRSFTWERNYPGANVIAQVLFQRVDAGDWRLLGLHAERMAAPLDELNAFTFTGKGPLHYLFLVLMAATAAVTLVAVTVWFRRRGSLRRRWLWLLAILVGVFQFTLNWTTGDVGAQALRFHLFSLGFGKLGPFAPVILTLSIPAGAIAFLFRLREQKAAVTDPEAGPPPLDAPPPGETPQA